MKIMTQERFSKTLKPVNTVKELLEQYEELVKYPECLRTVVTRYSQSTGRPIKTEEQPEEPKRALAVGFSMNMLLKPTDSLIRKINKSYSGVYTYKGKLYLFTKEIDQKEFYESVYIEQIEPKTIK